MALGCQPTGAVGAVFIGAMAEREGIRTLDTVFCVPHRSTAALGLSATSPYLAPSISNEGKDRVTHKANGSERQNHFHASCR